MKMKHVFVILAVLAISSMSSAVILLDDTFADGSRGETSLPTESADWVSHPEDVTMSVGSLAYTQTTSSHKLWTYFAADGSPVQVGVGQSLIATVEYIPRGLYVSSSEDWRMGLFYDPTDSQVLEDLNDDGGGSGDPWQDSGGYAVRVVNSSGAGDNPQVGKRIDMANTSLLGSSGAFTWDSGGADVENMVDDAVYYAIMEVARTGWNSVVATFTLKDASDNILTQHSITDTAFLGGIAAQREFDHLFFRFSDADGTSDVIDFQRITVELTPEPASMILLGLGGLFAIRRKR